jgi:hypothetical protein
MSGITLDRLRREGEELMQALSRESYLAHSGHKSSADFQGIYARFASILGRDALEATLEAFRSAKPQTEEARSARMLLEWQVDSQSGRSVAAIDEREIEWEGAAMVQLEGGRTIPYQSATIEIANTRDVNDRRTLDNARAAVAAKEHAPIRRERLQREREFIESLEIAKDYNSSFEALTGIDLTALASSCRQFLRDTQAMWDELLPDFLQRNLGIAARDATRADALALFRAPQFDDAFPGSAMEGAIRRQVTEMGVDPTAGGRVIYDVGERTGKRARAFCSPVRVPDEVYLVLLPHGGQVDYNTFLHELGHALHFGFARRDYPFEFRWLGDNSVTEGYAMLFDHRTQDGLWLQRYTELRKSRLHEFLRTAAFEDLHFLRRYAAKLLYEVEVHAHRGSWDVLPDRYVDTLYEGTSLRYQRSDAFIDLDPGYYSTRYLRAWQLQAVLDDALVERFDQDWFRNPAAGPWMTEHLFGEAQRETADELARRAGGGALSFAPLVRKLEAALAA